MPVVKERFPSVDILRGIALLSMTLFHPIWRLVPSFDYISRLFLAPAAAISQNAPFLEIAASFVKFAVGLALRFFLDLSYLAMGLFCFSLGIGLGISFVRRGGKPIFFKRHFLRFVVLFVLGFLLDFILMFGWKPHIITVLGIIATVGAETVVFLWLPRCARPVALFLMPFAFFAIQPIGATLLIDNSLSFVGAYGIFTLPIASCFGALAGIDLAEKKGLPPAKLFSFAIVLLCVISVLFWPIDFTRTGASPAYALVIAILGLAMLFLLEKTAVKNRFLQTLGYNALMIFVLEYLIIHYPWRIITNGEPIAFDLALVLAWIIIANFFYYKISFFLNARGIRLTV